MATVNRENILHHWEVVRNLFLNVVGEFQKLTPRFGCCAPRVNASTPPRTHSLYYLPPPFMGFIRPIAVSTSSPRSARDHCQSSGSWMGTCWLSERLPDSSPRKNKGSVWPHLSLLGHMHNHCHPQRENQERAETVWRGLIWEVQRSRLACITNRQNSLPWKYVFYQANVSLYGLNLLHLRDCKKYITEERLLKFDFFGGGK